MDTQGILDTALAANATTLGAAEAGKIFRQQLSSAIRVNVNLLPGQKAILQKAVSFPLVFTGGKTITNDHPLLVACRDVARDTFEAEFHIAETNERTLIVGSSAREIRKYNANPHIHFHIYGKENKDYDRIIRPALNDIAKLLKKKASKTNFLVFKPPENHPDTSKMRPVVKRYWKMEEVLKDYVTLHKMPDNIHTKLVEANTLVFEDSFYNFTEVDFIDLFDKTKAQMAYGYGMLPYELLFKDMPENPMYVVRQQGDRTTLIFRNGFCNGYSHETKAWSTLMAKPVMVSNKSATKLAVEITSRIGPMATFKIYKCNFTEHIVRSIELPERNKYVKILDVRACVNTRTGKVNRPLSYFSVNESEYLDVYNYTMSLDEKSVTYQNIIAYIRRRMGGVSLITKELIEPWYLSPRRVPDLALIVLLEYKLRSDQRKTIIENININSIAEKFLALIRKAGYAVMYPIAMLVEWIYAGHLVDKLVLFPDLAVYQHSKVINTELDITDALAGLYLDNPYEGDIPSCPVCFDLMGKLGEQIVKCDHLETEGNTLTLTDGQIQDLRAKLIDTDNDPEGLANVKKRCYQAMPVTGFQRKVKIYYIRAGPGCGKSYLIRKLATGHDLVLAPFTKLKPDYVNLKDENGDNYDLQFKTTHRAMETRGCKRIFVDEFTSMPYEFLACIAEVNAAEEIFLVGDEKQTKVQEPTEGLYIGNHLDLTKVSTHTLLVNFRNPKDTVALLNKVYGYQMYAKSEIEKSIEVVTTSEIPDVAVGTVMCFSKAASKIYTENEANTIRANQGGTVKTAIMYCVNNDGTLPSVEELQIVGLSRHTEKLYIVVDGCEQSKMLVDKINLNPEFYDHMQTWLSFPLEDTKEITREDECVEEIVKPLQPPRDSYLMLNTFLPSAAFDDVTTSLNHYASALVPEDFSTGKMNPDLIIMPTNKRNHPINFQTEYFSICAGIGNHFSAKSPIQTLQVLQARYFNKQPFFNFGNREKLLAEEMVDLWFKEHVQPNYRANLFDDMEIQAIISKFLTHITQRNYQAAFKGNNGIDNTDGRIIRFQLKGIFKPKHGDVDVMKAGQGISAWSTDACAMFCSVFRMLTTLVSKTEKEHVVTDAYKSEDQFINDALVQLQLISSIALNATTDGVTFDANQNRFTQEIEKTYWLRMGVSQEFLDHYYSFRSKYKVISTVALGFAGTQKTSGEPGTLVNNGIVSKITSNFIVRGEGPCCVIYKGDDFNKRQLNLKINQDNKTRLEAACSLGLRITIADTSEFCGLMFSSGTLFPSIPRKLNKLSAHRFRDYKHFCEYQCSLRDWISLIARNDEMHIVAHNSNHYKTDFTEMQAALDTIKSFAHIDFEQFKTTFKKRKEASVIPTTNLFGGINMLLN